jgi:ribonucleotide reductase beta subunit family protein with ferritin-like domain
VVRESKVPLLQITEDFVKREYKYSAGVIDNSLQIESSTGDSYFKYIGNELMKCDKGNTDRVYN